MSPSGADGRRASWPSWCRMPRPGSSAMPTGNCARATRMTRFLRFARFWKKRTGRYPEELIFDSKLTTYAKLNELNRLGIQFITLRRRSKGLMREIDQTPPSAWRRIELEGGLAAIYASPHPRPADHLVRLRWADPAGDDRRFGPRGADDPADQPTDGNGGQADRALRPADDHREQHRGWDRLLPHGRL